MGGGAVHAAGVDGWSWVAGALRRTSERGEGDGSSARWSRAIGRGLLGGPDLGGGGGSWSGRAREAVLDSVDGSGFGRLGAVLSDGTGSPNCMLQRQIMGW
jgi:hypothetical protein